MSKFHVNLKSFKCLKGTTELSSDEPYVIVFAARLNDTLGVKIPTAHSLLYGPWTGVDAGDSGRTGFFFFGPGGAPLSPPENFWGLSGKPEELAKDDDAIMLVALMENDDSRPEGVREGLHVQMFASLTSYANAAMTRSDMVAKLLKDMHDALKGPITIGLPNNDDLIGVAELRISSEHQQQASKITSLHMVGDGGSYELFFEAVKH